MLGLPYSSESALGLAQHWESNTGKRFNGPNRARWPTSQIDQLVHSALLVTQCLEIQRHHSLLLSSVTLNAPYCRAFHETTFPQLKRDYIDTGLVRFVHKDLPLPFHPQARIAAESARCSLNQTEYWQVYRALFRQQDCLSCKGAASIAKTASQNPHHFEQCLRSQASKAAVERNLTDAMAIGIRATPALVIGISQGQRHSGQTIEGVPPWPALHAQLQRELKGRSKTSTDR